PRQPEVVVGVEVADEDVRELDQPDSGTQKLPLRTLATVEEQPSATTPDERRRRAAASRRYGAGRAEKHDVEVHAASVRPLLRPLAAREPALLSASDRRARSAPRCARSRLADRRRNWRRRSTRACRPAVRDRSA